jgi:hypothetical protein
VLTRWNMLSMVRSGMLPLGGLPSITHFPWAGMTRDSSIEVDHQGKTRQLTQFPKLVIHYLTPPKDLHPYSR